MSCSRSNPRLEANMVRQRQPRIKAPEHLELIRRLPCLACGYSAGRVQAAHVSMSDALLGKRGRGLGMKSDDRWVVPLCFSCHERQHKMGELPFWEEIEIYPLMVAYALWLASRTDAMRQMVMRARG